jgi:hypothetical protein
VLDVAMEIDLWPQRHRERRRHVGMMRQICYDSSFCCNIGAASDGNDTIS